MSSSSWLSCSSMHGEEAAAGWSEGTSWQFEGRRSSSARQALVSSSSSSLSSVMREWRSDAESS
eukprot:scaffold16856_cov60-Phaeocystis_antarctica.AAC.2